MLIIILVMFPFSKVQAESLTSQMINQEKETFGISDFLMKQKSIQMIFLKT